MTFRRRDFLNLCGAALAAAALPAEETLAQSASSGWMPVFTTIENGRLGQTGRVTAHHE